MTGEECILGGAVVLGIIPKLQWPVSCLFLMAFEWPFSGSTFIKTDELNWFCRIVS